MIDLISKQKSTLARFSANEAIDFYTEDEINAITKAYLDYMQEAEDLNKEKLLMKRWRQFIIFQTLRETGARISEVLSIDDNKDINYRLNAIKIRTLKRKKEMYRTVFISNKLIAEISRFLAQYPNFRGKLFKTKVRGVQKFFEKMCEKANIEKKKRHVHLLRHTRAVEYLKANVPLHHIKQLLGHASILTTSVYLNTYSSEIFQILQERNFI